MLRRGRNREMNERMYVGILLDVTIRSMNGAPALMAEACLVCKCSGPS